MAEPMLEVLTRSPEHKSERLAELEGVIRRGKEALLEAGRALREIRDEEYFRPDYEDFGTYCYERFGWGKRQANRHIAWAETHEKLGPIGLDIKNEAQARELYPLVDEPEAALEVWKRAGEQSGGARPARVIRDAMRELGYVPVPEGVELEEAEEVLEGYAEVKSSEHGKEHLTPGVSKRTSRNRVERLHREAEARKRRENVRPTTETGAGGVNIHNMDFGDLGALVPDSGVDLVLTDPPYHTGDETMSLWDGLGAFAKRVLKPDGLLVSYMGNYAIPKAIRRVEENVPWWWQMIVLYGGKDTAHRKGFVLDYKPIQVFTSPDREPGKGLAGARPSIIESRGKEKSHHDWQQPLVESVHLILSFTEPGDLVVDPFSGGGTVAVAAKMTGRRCVAAEIDPTAHAQSVQRLKDAPSSVPEEIADALRSAHPGVFPPKGARPGDPGKVEGLFRAPAPSPQARTAETQERRIEGVRDALERVSAEVIVLRPRDLSESGRKLRRRRFTR